MTEEQYKRLKREVEESKAEADRAQGALDQLMVKLKQDFDTNNLVRATKLLGEWAEKVEAAEEAFIKSVQDYEKKWSKTKE